MPALEPLSSLIKKSSIKLSKEEQGLLEAEIFVRIYEKLKEIFRQEHLNYFRSLKFTTEMENVMLETSFTRLIIRDILATGEYTLQGIAQYTNTHEDVVEEIAAGLNDKPLASFLRKAIELHRSVRQELYQSIKNKISSEYLVE